MSVPGRTEFLDRGAYRQRRLRDAARVLPFFALVFMLVPLLWPGPRGVGHAPSEMLTYLFGVWGLFVAVWFVLSRRLKLEQEHEQTGAGPADPSPSETSPTETSGEARP